MKIDHHPLRQLSPQDFAAFGLNVIAYVKPALVDDNPMFAIHAADGTPLTVVSDLAVAQAVIRQHEMEPATVH
jgi:hypothetical protein